MITKQKAAKAKLAKAAKAASNTGAETVKSPLNFGFLELHARGGARVEWDRNNGEFVVYVTDSLIKSEKGNNLSARFTDARLTENYFSALLLLIAIAHLRDDEPRESGFGMFAERTLLWKEVEGAEEQVQTLQEASLN